MGLAFGPTFEGVGEWALRPAGAVPELRNWDGWLCARAVLSIGGGDDELRRLAAMAR